MPIISSFDKKFPSFNSAALLIFLIYIMLLCTFIYIGLSPLLADNIAFYGFGIFRFTLVPESLSLNTSGTAEILETSALFYTKQNINKLGYFHLKQ